MVTFEWDADKEKVNIAKHGVTFTDAQRVFQDVHRKIFIDAKHGEQEDRYFCIGKVSEKIMTVRFTYRSNVIRIIGAGYWRKGRTYYGE